MGVGIFTLIRLPRWAHGHGTQGTLINCTYVIWVWNLFVMHLLHLHLALAAGRSSNKGLENKKCTQSMTRCEEAAPCLVCMRNIPFTLRSSGDKKVRLLLPLQEGQIFVHCRGLRSGTSCSVCSTRPKRLQCITYFPSQRGPAQSARATGARYRTLYLREKRKDIICTRKFVLLYLRD